MNRSILFIILILSIVSCQDDLSYGQEDTTVNNNIEDELYSHFKTFQDEAQNYGITIDYESSNVTAEIIKIDLGTVAGTCTTNGQSIRHIEIDESFWNQASNLQREMVIFHELGHCILNRGHSEEALENGICKSIMRSGLGSCVDAYSLTNRSYFIEELFTQIE